MPISRILDISRQKVLFSWALAETLSPRWRTTMTKGMNKTLRQKLATGGPYSDADQEELIGRLRARRGDYIKYYIEPARSFRLIDLPSASLASLAVSPTIGWRDQPVQLEAFISGKYDPNNARDPRNAAKRLLEAPESIPYTGHPIIAHDPKFGCDVLIEGYTRCISRLLRLQRGETLPPVAVIQCVR